MFKGLNYDNIKRWIAENTFKIWRQEEIKAINSVKDEGKMRWPDNLLYNNIYLT